MRILLDVDGVIADFVGHIVAAGVLSPIVEMDLRSSLTNEELSMVQSLAARKGFCSEIPAYEGAREFVLSLQTIGEVFAVTAPWHSETWEYERRAWLQNVGIEPKRVISCSAYAKSCVQGDILIEDHPKTAFDWLEENNLGFAILRDLPWNRPHTNTFKAAGDHERMYRSHTYEQILEEIQRLKDLMYGQ